MEEFFKKGKRPRGCFSAQTHPHCFSLLFSLWLALTQASKERRMWRRNEQVHRWIRKHCPQRLPQECVCRYLCVGAPPWWPERVLQRLAWSFASAVGDAHMCRMSRALNLSGAYVQVICWGFTLKIKVQLRPRSSASEYGLNTRQTQKVGVWFLVSSLNLESWHILLRPAVFFFFFKLCPLVAHFSLTAGFW